MDWNVQIGAKTHKVTLPESLPNNLEFEVKLNGRILKARWLRDTKTLLFLDPAKGNNAWSSVNTRYKTVTSFPQEPDVTVNLEFLASGSKNTTCVEAIINLDAPGRHSHDEGQAVSKVKIVRSQITGKVLSVLVNQGDTVSVGDTLMVVEAMKMEIRILSSYAGKIEKIAVTAGAMVSNGGELLRIK